MSGFVAAFSNSLGTDIAAAVQRMSARIAHRGLVSRITDFEGRAAVATRCHRQGAYKAVASVDSERVVVFDGLLFNEEDICRKTGVATLSDAIWAGFNRWGPEWFSELDGSFAIIVHDPQRDVFVTARDRFGHRPLLFALTKGAVLFGSESKAFFAYPGFVRALHEESIRGVVSIGLVLGPHTLLRDTHKALPGHVAIIRNRAIIEHSLFYRPRTVVDETRTLDEVESFVDESLTRAIATYRAKTDRIGVLLSGGIDSTLLASKLANHGGPAGHAVSFGATNWTDEESGSAQNIASKLGLPFTRAQVHHDFDALAYLRSAIWHIEEPTRFQNAIALEVAMEASAYHMDSVLTGESGDLFFGERAHIIARLLPTLHRVPDGLRKSSSRTLERLPVPILRRLGRYVDSDSQEHYLRRALAWAPMLDERDLPQTKLDQMAGLEASFSDLDSMGVFTLVNLMGYWYPWIERMEQIGSAHGLDVLHPFQRNEVLEYALTTPFRLKVTRAGTVKPALRNLAERVAGRAVARGAKKQLAAPIGLWLDQSAPLREAVLELRDPDSRFRAVVDPERADRFLDDFARSGSAHQATRQAVFILLSLEVWLSLFLEPGVRGGAE